MIRKIEENIKEMIDVFYETVSGMHDLQKQHNKMLMDLYERVAKLEKKEEDG